MLIKSAMAENINEVPLIVSVPLPVFEDALKASSAKNLPLREWVVNAIKSAVVSEAKL